MRLIVYISIILFWTSCASFFMSRGYVWDVGTDKKMAILPFEVLMANKEFPEGDEVKSLEKYEEIQSYHMQRDMYRYFLREMFSNGFDTSFVQDVNDSNDRLMEAGIYYQNLGQVSYDSLASILEVDALVAGRVVELPRSGFFTGFLGRKSDPEIRMHGMFYLLDGDDGSLLWRFEEKTNGGGENTTYTLSKDIMRKVASNFPFRDR
ncbi:MAG: hypothetical protein OEQ53_22850 [Saprospiraceae bacterium]|nr:hypothetical protein [Saprospiraceae bacterium]